MAAAFATLSEIKTIPYNINFIGKTSSKKQISRIGSVFNSGCLYTAGLIFMLFYLFSLCVCVCVSVYEKERERENQDGGVGRHTAPPRTTRTDRESNSKGDQHQGNRK